MIAHYVERHEYLPPAEFIAAVLACRSLVPGRTQPRLNDSRSAMIEWGCGRRASRITRRWSGPRRWYIRSSVAPPRPLKGIYLRRQETTVRLTPAQGGMCWLLGERLPMGTPHEWSLVDIIRHGHALLV